MEKKMFKKELNENQIKLSEKELKKILGGTSEEIETETPGFESDVTIRFCGTTKRCTFVKKSRA